MGQGTRLRQRQIVVSSLPWLSCPLTVVNYGTQKNVTWKWRNAEDLEWADRNKASWGAGRNMASGCHGNRSIWEGSQKARYIDMSGQLEAPSLKVTRSPAAHSSLLSPSTLLRRLECSAFRFASTSTCCGLPLFLHLHLQCGPFYKAQLERQILILSFCFSFTSVICE